MKKIYYNKLIRDKVPAQMDRAGAAYKIKKLSRKEFEKELIKKAEEEASGLQRARNKKELSQELADVLDVVEEIKRVKRIGTEKIEEMREENARKKGGFRKRTYLFWSEDKGYRTNEIRR